MEQQIKLEGIAKSFQVSRRPAGRFAALRGLFRRETERIMAVDNITFSIGTGELVGYIGPNGAGKSTTVKVMSGILTPEEGQCRILGRIPWKNRMEHVAHIGVVFGQRSQLWWDVPVRDSFELLRDIYGLTGAAYRQRLAELDGALELAPLLGTPVRQLSLGQRMRCEVGAALLHRPEILFLDEPTIGLDAVSKLALREFLQAENRENGVTMVLTTHDMDDVEALCQRVMTIGHGRLLFDGSLERLRARFAPLNRLRATLGERPALLPAWEGVERQEWSGRELTLWFDDARLPAQELIARLASLSTLGSIVVERQDTNEMIAAMYKQMAL